MAVEVTLKQDRLTDPQVAATATGKGHAVWAAFAEFRRRGEDSRAPGSSPQRPAPARPCRPSASVLGPVGPLPGHATALGGPLHRKCSEVMRFSGVETRTALGQEPNPGEGAAGKGGTGHWSVADREMTTETGK